MISNLYIIKTLNSMFEVQVSDVGSARARKNGGEWKSVQVEIDDLAFLDKLTIGLPFYIPGCWEPTSNVQDYQSFVPSGEERRRASAGGLTEMIDAMLAPVRGRAIHVND